MFNTALRTSHTPSKRPVRLRQRRKVESAPGRRVSAGVYSLRQCSFSTLWGLWHTVHTLRTTVVMYSTRMYTRIALGEMLGGTRHSSGRNALTDRWQTGLLQAPAQGGACLSRGRCPAPSSTTRRTKRRSPRPPVPRPGPGSVAGVRAGVGVSVRRGLVAALAFGSP